MKTKLKCRMSAISVLVIVLVGCASPQIVHPLNPPAQTETPPRSPSTAILPPPTRLPPTPTPPLPPVCQSLESQDTLSGLSGSEIVIEMIARLNDNDVGEAMSYFAEDARIYISGVPPVGFEIHAGKEAICRILAGYASNNVEWEVKINTANTFSNVTRITAKSKVWLDPYRQHGAAPNMFSDFIVVKDGRITQYAQTLYEESLAKLRTNLPDDFPKTTPDKSAPGSTANISFSDITCTYHGPTTWKTGEFEFNLEIKDQGEVQYGLVLINLDEGYDFFDLATAIDEGKPAWVRYSNIAEYTGWKSKVVQYSMQGNPKYLMCMAEQVSDYVIGLIGPFEVQP